MVFAVFKTVGRDFAAAGSIPASSDMENKYASLPQVGKLLEKEELVRWFPKISRPLVTERIQEVLAAVRGEIADGGPTPDESEILSRIEAACGATCRKRIGKIMNGTGVILHTNMGRSPIAPEVWDSVRDLNTSYCNVELDLETGKRGRRSGIVADLLRSLTGAENALVVNNNSAAVLLLLSALAKGKEVVVSRGEQVQIGGGFRVPEILELSGARLVEVGTTNITTVKDYLDAVNSKTAMVLFVHTSNFKIRGFTSRPSVGELAKRLPGNVVLAVDQGSGVTTERIPGETRVRRLLEEGAKIVTFSGDKILGGPQAGLVVGDRKLVALLGRNPLMRAFRPGKTVYSLLEESLVRKLNGPEPGYAESVYSKSTEELRRFGRRVLKGIPKELADLVPVTATTGGGSAPDEYFHSLAVEIRGPGKPEEIVRKLRERPLPIIAVVEDGAVRLNLSTLFRENPAEIRESLEDVLDLPKPSDSAEEDSGDASVREP